MLETGSYAVHWKIIPDVRCLKALGSVLWATSWCIFNFQNPVLKLSRRPWGTTEFGTAQCPVGKSEFQKDRYSKRACVRECMRFQQRCGGSRLSVLVGIQVNYAFKYAHGIFWGSIVVQASPTQKTSIECCSKANLIAFSVSTRNDLFSRFIDSSNRDTNSRNRSLPLIYKHDQKSISPDNI